MLVFVGLYGALLCLGAFLALGLWLYAAAAFGIFCWAQLIRSRARSRVLSFVGYSKSKSFQSMLPTEAQLYEGLLESHELLKVREWERDVSTQIARPIEDHPLIKELTETNDLRKFSTVELYQRVLTIVAGFTRAQAAGVIFKTAEGANITAYGVAGRRFERHLRSLGEEFWRGNTAVLGLHDSFAKNAVWGGAGSFGHRFSLALPMTAISGFDSSVLWLGYAHGSQPNSVERAAAERLVQAVSEALVKANTLATLDNRASTAEVEKQHADKMLAHISHDIRTPLANVKGILHLLSSPSSDSVSEVPELTRVALQNCDELGELIGDVIDFTRGRTGQLASRKSSIELAEMCKTIVSAFSVAARQRGLTLDVHADGPVLINGDSGHIKRAISNLISNALKYTTHGGVTVRLDTRGTTSRLEVSDTGLGMTPEQLSKVFTPFSRFHVDRAEGIGLGLAITKLFVEEHGGKISVESTPSVGTIFTVLLPLQSSQAGAVLIETQSISNAVPRILLVDDDIDVGASLARLLRQGGCDVDCINTVDAARAAIASGVYDVVVTDLSMPGGGGRAVLDCTQALGVDAPALFVLTGEFNSDLVIALKARGALDVFEKPIDHTVLLSEIRAVLQSRKNRTPRLNQQASR